jgi:hypothetical protein
MRESLESLVISFIVGVRLDDHPVRNLSAE